MAFRYASELAEQADLATAQGGFDGSANRRSVSDTSINLMGVLFRWMMWCLNGPLILVLLAFHAAIVKDGWFSILDLAFALLLIGTIGLRWIALAHGDQTETTRETTSSAANQRYSFSLLIFGLALWIVPNVIANGLPH